jgi:ribosomal protein S18 acetylase RimI-like enzyme
LIIPDFRFFRSNGPFLRAGIRAHRPENQVEISLKMRSHRLYAPGAGHLEITGKPSPQPKIGHNLLRSAVLMQHFSPSLRSQRPGLLSLFAVINHTRCKLEVELNRLPLQLYYFEFHIFSLGRNKHAVNPWMRQGLPAHHARHLSCIPSAILRTMPHPELRIRTATAADSERLIPLINTAFSLEIFLEKPRTDPERFAAAMETGTILVGEDVTGTIFASVYTEVRGPRGYIGMLAVNPARQRSGLGRRMMQAAEDRLRSLGCKAVDINVLSLRPELPPLYRKLGFVETGTEPFNYPYAIAGNQPCHCIIMSKSL